MPETLRDAYFGKLPERPQYGTPEMIQARDIAPGDVVEHHKGRWAKPCKVERVSFGWNGETVLHLEGTKGIVPCPPDTLFARYPDQEV